MPTEWPSGDSTSPAASALAGQLGQLPQTVLDGIPMGIAVVAVPGLEVLASNAWFDRFLESSVRAGGAVGRRLTDLLPPDRYGNAAALVEQVRATGEPITVSDQLVQHADLGQLYLRFSLSPTKDESGHLVSVVLAGEDATEEVYARRQAEELAERLRSANEQLHLANLRLQTIIGQLPQGVVAIDRDGRVLLTNRAAERLMGFALTPGVVFYSLPATRIKSDGTPYGVDELPMPRSLKGETSYGIEITVTRPDGSIVHTLCSSAPIEDSSGQIVAAVSIFQDITELRQVDRMKDEFLSVASHELKNPLTVLKGYVQLLLRDSARVEPAREAQMLGVIDREVNRLTHLINVMLDVSRIQLGALQLVRQSTDLVALARKLLDGLQALSPSHRISFRTEVDEVVGQWDPLRIEQVLANLVDNAVKYSPRGGAVVVSLLVGEEEVEVAVQDHGIGILPELQDKVFQKFFRAESRVAEHVAGMGLGLYVCQEIVRAHGGRIWLESEPRVGSTFHFALPLPSSLP
jgi:signal transduction histidine kinase